MGWFVSVACHKPKERSKVRPWKTNFAKRTHVSSLELCRSQFDYLQKGAKSKSWLQCTGRLCMLSPKRTRLRRRPGKEQPGHRRTALSPAALRFFSKIPEIASGLIGQDLLSPSSPAGRRNAESLLRLFPFACGEFYFARSSRSRPARATCQHRGGQIARLFISRVVRTSRTKDCEARSEK